MVAVFILFAMVIALVIGVSLNIRIQSAYYDTFRDGIVSGFDRWTAKHDWTYGEMRGVSVEEVRRLLADGNEARIYFYLVSSWRTYALIDASATTVAASNDPLYQEGDGGPLLYSLLSSKNLLTVMSGADRGADTGLVRASGNAYFDYAIRLGLAEGDYILYFRYDSREFSPVLERFNQSILSSLAIAIVAALFMGVLFAQTITVPLFRLRDKSRQLAAGDFGSMLDARSDDEIGELTNAFNHMAREIQSNLLAISSEKSKVETILAYMTDGVVAFSLDGRIIHINPAAQRMLGVGADSDFDAFAAKFGLGLSVRDVAGTRDATGREVSFEYEGRSVHAYFGLYYDEAGTVGGVVGVFQDNTEQMRMDRMRKEFVANVSHELRTPITAIKSYSETLLDGGVDADTGRHFLEVINAEADRMAILVRDLLQLSSLDYMRSRGEDGALQLTCASFPLADLVTRCVEKCRVAARARKIEIAVSVSEDAPEVTADFNRIEQVLLNVIGNSIKYMTDGGRVEVLTGASDRWAFVKVVDNGIGISAEDLPRVFERFYRADKARSRELGGTGLGLAIAKEIMDLHGGEIGIDSEPGKGTEVTIRLPLERKRHAKGG
jgi:two-component system sensor histidine kinase VicK